MRITDGTRTVRAMQASTKMAAAKPGPIGVRDRAQLVVLAYETGLVRSNWLT